MRVKVLKTNRLWSIKYISFVKNHQGGWLVDKWKLFRGREKYKWGEGQCLSPIEIIRGKMIKGATRATLMIFSMSSIVRRWILYSSNITLSLQCEMNAHLALKRLPCSACLSSNARLKTDGARHKIYCWSSQKSLWGETTKGCLSLEERPSRV